MHNFGQGMWRRVGDFERLQVPQIIKHIELEQALLYKEYIKNLQRQQYIRKYRQQVLEKVNAVNTNEKQIIFENSNILTNSEKKRDLIQEDKLDVEIVAIETEIPPIEKHEEKVEEISVNNSIEKKNLKANRKKGKRRS